MRVVHHVPVIVVVVVVVVVTGENKNNQPTLVEFDLHLQVGEEFDNLIIVINFIWCYKYLRAFQPIQK